MQFNTLTLTLQNFISALSGAYGNIQGAANSLLSILIGIEVVLLGLWAALGGGDNVAGVFKRILHIGAWVWIVQAYPTLAKALRDSPVPPEVKTDDQKADYQAQIEEFAVPMEERSLDAYENGWQKATSLGIYNQWTAKMRDALGRLNSELYPPFKETGFEVRSQGPLPLPPLIEAPNRPVASTTGQQGSRK